MCYSAGASFVGGAVISAVGVATVKEAGHPCPSSKLHPGQNVIVDHPIRGGFMNRKWIGGGIV